MFNVSEAPKPHDDASVGFKSKILQIYYFHYLLMSKNDELGKTIKAGHVFLVFALVFLLQLKSKCDLLYSPAGS